MRINPRAKNFIRSLPLAPHLCASKQFFDSRAYGTIRLRDDFVARNKGHVEAWLQPRRCLPHRLAHQALGTVADYRAADVPGNHKAKAVARKAIGRNREGQQRMAPGSALGTQARKIGAVLEAELALHRRQQPLAVPVDLLDVTRRNRQLVTALGATGLQYATAIFG